MNDIHRLFEFCAVCLSVAWQTTAIDYISSEPDYKHMLYGGVWKHVVLNPSDHLQDVAQAIEHIQSFMRIRYSKYVLENLTVTCLSRLDLWFSKSDHDPLTVTRSTRSGDQFPVSVPVSFGSTYNFLVTFSKNDSVTIVNFITTTVALEMEGFYMYANTDHLLGGNLHEHFQCCEFCTKGKSMQLQILSNTASNKNLELTSDKECNKDPDCLLDYLQEQTEMSSDFSKDDANYGKETNKSIEKMLKVVTYNIWNFNTYQKNGDYLGRINRISDLLQISKPDIIAFQEVRLETPLGGKLGPSQMDHLISFLPQYQFVFQPAQMLKNSLEQGRTEEGLAIFSRFPIIHHDYLLLFRNQSNPADIHQRICLHAVIFIPSFGKVHVFNSHFSLSHEAREVAVKQIQEYMSCFDAKLVILMGDLNAKPEETSVRLLTTDLLDIWDHMHPSSDGFTYSTLEDRLSKRIDYIFMRKTDSATVQKVEVVHDQNRYEAASDHRPLLATFSLKSMVT